MNTPLFKSLKTNGTTFYVLPSVAEDKNFEKSNENYKMQVSHFALVNFPREVVSSTLDFEDAFNQNGSSIAPAAFKDRLVESLRNYVANHSTVIRNSKLNSNEFYYDTNEPYTTDEKIFWKWCKKLGIIQFETANPTEEYFGSDPKYNDNGPTGNTNHFREYLWKERSTTVYDVSTAVGAGIAFSVPGTTVPSVIPAAPGGYQQVTITLTASTQFRPGDYIIINRPDLDTVPHYSTTESRIKVVGVATFNTLNDQIIVEIDSTANIGDFGTISTIDLYSAYQRFVQLIGEITGINNVQHPDRAWTEVQANISYQHGQIPYALWNTKTDNNYKPGSAFPILSSELQAEIQGGESPTNPILTNPSGYPGDIWGQFDTPGFTYTTEAGNIIRRSGAYFGQQSANNTAPTLLYPDFDGNTVDGLTLNLGINDYAKAISYVFPVESFNEFTATAFNNTAPKDFQFNAVIWFYTIEDTSGSVVSKATNIYGIEFLDTPDNDTDLVNKNMIPANRKWVSNGYQDGNAYTFALDFNYAIDSDVAPPSFDPDKIYSLFGMELYYEALTRMTYFNDQVSNLLNNNQTLASKIDNLQSLVYTQQTLESIRSRMDNIDRLLNVYSTLQIGNSATIIPVLDTSVSPPVVRLNSVDKQYGYVYTFNTKDMFADFTNINSFTEYSATEKSVQVQNGKDFLVVVNNNDYNDPAVQYDPGILLPPLSLVIEKDLEYQQKIDIIIQPKSENIVNGKPIWDKKMNLWINYDDATSVNKILLKNIDLPVIEAKQGSSRLPEFGYEFNEVPDFKVRDIWYTMPTSAERNFVFTIEDDLVYSYYNATGPVVNKKLQQSMRIFMDNFFLNSNPSAPAPNPTYRNMSGQYELSIDPTYGIGEVYEIEVVDPGAGGYVANQTYVYDVPFTPLPGIFKLKLYVQTDAAGKVLGAYMLTPGQFAVTPVSADFSTFTFNYAGTSALDLTGASQTVPSAPILANRAVFRAKTRRVTQVNVKINNFTTDPSLNAFLTSYDTALGVLSKPLNTRFDLRMYTKMTPLISFLKAWKISITRISDIANIPLTQVEKRYNIKIDRF